RQSKRNSFQQQRSEGERFSIMPFIGSALFKDFALVIEDDAFDLWLNLETLRDAGESINDGLERFLADRRRFRCACVFRLKYCRRFLELGLFTALLLFDG